MTRGDAYNPKHNNTRNKEYFESYNFKEKEDDELKNKIYGKKKLLINDNTLSIDPLSSEPLSSDPLSSEPLSIDPLSSDPLSSDPLSSDPLSKEPLSNVILPRDNLLTKNIEIVISRYNENLDWTTEYPFNQFKYTVYNKGINENFNKTNVKKMIPLPNVGMCDHTYLYHIVSNYDSNSLKLITIFFPGSLNMIEKLNRGVELIMKVFLKQTAFFIGKHTTSILDLFFNFTIDTHKLGHSENFNLSSNVDLIKCNIRPFGNWYNYNFGKINVPYYTYNGIFSFDKRDIMKFNKNKYENLLKQLSVGQKLESAHYMERSWGAIFHPLIYTKVLLTYEHSSKNQSLISNAIKMNMNIDKLLPTIVNRSTKQVRQSRPNIRNNNNLNKRNPRIQNYLRSLWLRRNFFRRRINRGGFIRKNRNFFRY
jgi:hypothetical protein